MCNLIHVNISSGVINNKPEEIPQDRWNLGWEGINVTRGVTKELLRRCS